MSLSAPVIILVRPQLGENIGMAARAMCNFGLSHMRLVAPRDGFAVDGAVFAAAVATSSGADSIVRKAALFPDIASAICDLEVAYATTARSRAQGKPIQTPAQAMPDIVTRAAGGRAIGVVFGPERTGLDNADIALCNKVISIPVDPGFSSLNLAQAVLVLGYEWRRVMAGEAPFETGEPRVLAQRAGVLSFFDFLDASLAEVGYFRPEEKRPIMMRNLQNILHRMEMSEQDLRSLRGAFEALYHGGRNKKQNATGAADRAQPNNV